jgi:voltage-gated potassium channel
MIRKYKDHAVICGSGSFARALVEQLLRRNIDVVVVGDDETSMAEIANRFPNVPLLKRSPMCELTLAQSNLLSARVVIAATDCDVNNLLIAMTCKDIRPDLKVIALTEDGNTAGRMHKIGVDEIVCPALLGGQYAANLVTGAESNRADAFESLQLQF